MPRQRIVETAQTQVYFLHFRKNHHRLLFGNWNVLTLTGKELELVEETKEYHLNIVGSSSTMKRGSRIVDLDGVESFSIQVLIQVLSAEAGVEILKSPQLTDCVFDWIPLGLRACMLKLNVKDRSLCLLQMYAQSAVTEYQAFVDDVKDALQRVGSTKFTIHLGDFNAHIGTDNETRK